MSSLRPPRAARTRRRKSCTPAALRHLGGAVLVAWVAWLAGVPAAAEAEPEPDAPGSAEPDADRVREYRLKAAILYNFILYTGWPEDAFDGEEDPIVVQVVGRDPFGDVLEEVLGGKSLHGRPLEIDRIREVPEEVEAHVVFAGGMEPVEREALVELCREEPVLLVSDVREFAEQGGAVNLLIEEERIRFDINIDVVRDAELKISSQLLKLARRIVHDEEDGE